MTDANSLNVQLLQQVLRAAEALEINAASLAVKAGIKPETISRAKKRGDMHLGTMARLASVVGLELVLQPIALLIEPINTSATSFATANAATGRAALADPRFGLAGMNPNNAKEGVLLRIALIQGRYNCILESAAVDGVPFVMEQMKILRVAGDINEEVEGKLERMIRSIEKGFAQAMSENSVHS